MHTNPTHPDAEARINQLLEMHKRTVNKRKSEDISTQEKNTGEGCEDKDCPCNQK